MSHRDPKYQPSRRQEAFDWYLSRVLRLLGGGMIIWELAIDSGKNPLVLLLGAMLATTKDAISIGRDLIKQARAENEELNREIDKTQRQREKESSDA